MNSESILVVNCGSSSLKFSLICLSTQHTLLTGLAECLATSDAKITFKQNGEKLAVNLSEPFDHQVAIAALIERLETLQLKDNIVAVGHRTVHGGEVYSQPTLIDNDVIQQIEKLASLAPLHNPANLIGIRATMDAFAELPQVAVFDTAFHQTMPEKAYLYAIPYSLYKEHGIRRYGFHGTSHYFVANQAAEMLNLPIEQTNLITAHLGNGCSISAIANGQSVDTSMGLTPLEGVAMGTRSGDIDPGLLLHLERTLGYSIEQVDKLLNKESGLKGLSQMSNDCRTLEEAAIENNDEKAILALDVFCYRIAKTIASYSAALNKLDALVFTGGIGENSDYIREKVLSHLSLLGFELNEQQNIDCRFGQSGNISNSRPCLVIPTNEEWVIAEQTLQVIKEQ